jgi:hypothetical protein
MFPQPPQAHNPSMYSFFLFAEYRPCPYCGVPVNQAQDEQHECDPERRVDWELFVMRDEVQAFDRDLVDWLGTPAGRFEVWYAERQRAGAGEAAT